MSELFDKAAMLLEEKYTPPVHSTAAALRTESGDIITAVNIDHFLGLVCAETAALTIAINSGQYEFDSVIAVRKNNIGETAVANMCGKCRQIFYDFAPGISVETVDGVKKIDELLPDAFNRQREKIEDALKGRL